jgi:cytochrome c oxidase subunit I+III
MPVFAWAMLVFALMVVFAFPAVILATLQLELERAFGWPFFDAARGGDPLLWQHLFWFFGHPEVYIIFLPAAGMVSMILPTMVRAPLVGYRLVVLAIVATGFLSFGLWVHHMFTTGIPRLSLAFFQAASMAVSIPAGIQVFAWIATLARRRMRVTVPGLFILGFLFTFVAGGLTGVMLAAVPFDWQAHDTYFVVAHLHYVLIGGMVFPLFAAFYYWTPFVSRHALSERLGRWVFGLMFTGFHVAFFPMHVTGLAGMPRRVHTYAAAAGWDVLNMTSTVGAFMIAAGVALFIVDLARRLRPTMDHNAGDVWDAPTLEWLPTGPHSMRSIPTVKSREPLWDQPGLADEVHEGRHYLPRTATGGRETLLTAPLDARPQFLLRMPPLGWSPFVGAVFTAAFFLLLTGKLVVPAVACGIVAVAALACWAWQLDPAPLAEPIDIGGGVRVPAYASGPDSHSWWGVVVLLLVSGSLYGCALFSYLYLWTVAPRQWPAEASLPGLVPALASAALAALSSVAVEVANRELTERRANGVIAALVVGLGLLAAAVGGEMFAQRALSPSTSGYGAAVWLLLVLAAWSATAAAATASNAIARAAAGRLDATWRSSFDVARLFWHYAVAQVLAGIVLVHSFPRLAASP